MRRSTNVPSSTASRTKQASLAYTSRDHAIVTMAFDASANLETVSEHLSAFLQAFAPREGLQVRASRGARREVLEARFTATSSVSARQLARGGNLELSGAELDPAERCRAPLFWIASAPNTDDDDDAVASLRFGATFGRPDSERGERAIAQALTTFVEACVELEGCLSAIVTAQGPPISLADPSLAYERLIQTEAEGARTEFLRAHVRAPGWRVLAPRTLSRALVKRTCDGVSVERVRSGLLARLESGSLYAASLEPMEEWLRPVLGRRRA